MLQRITVCHTALLVVVSIYWSQVLYDSIVFQDLHYISYLTFRIIIKRDTEDFNQMLVKCIRHILASTQLDIEIKLLLAFRLPTIEQKPDNDAVPIHDALHAHKAAEETTHHHVVADTAILIVGTEQFLHLV